MFYYKDDNGLRYKSSVILISSKLIEITKEEYEAEEDE